MTLQLTYQPIHPGIVQVLPTGCTFQGNKTCHVQQLHGIWQHNGATADCHCHGHVAHPSTSQPLCDNPQKEGVAFVPWLLCPVPLLLH